jgi:hypothetical protein
MVKQTCSQYPLTSSNVHYNISVHISQMLCSWSAFPLVWGKRESSLLDTNK